jgi:hypothetical protein
MPNRRPRGIRAKRTTLFITSPHLRQFLRTPKGTLLVIFLGLLVIAATAVGWSAALPHMLVAVLGVSLPELVIS